MKFPEKLDVLTVHATLIAETGGTGGLRNEAYLSRLSSPLKIAIIMRLPML